MSSAAGTVETALGKVTSPPSRESTSDEFYFWVREGVIVEKSQIVWTECQVGGTPIRFFAVVREVYRQSRVRDVAEERDRYDGDVGYQPSYVAPGFTYASASILRTLPLCYSPPMEGAGVYLAGEADVRLAYSADEIENPLAVGLVRNGGSQLAGPGVIDLDYLLGANGGHANVNGVAGRGTKSSFLLHLNMLLMREAERQKHERQSDRDRLRVVPIILNVKNFDLFFIDHLSTRWKPEKHLAEWQALGIPDPQPFKNVKFYARQDVRTQNPVDVGRTKSDVVPFSYSLADVIQGGSFQDLFADDDLSDHNFGALVYGLESHLTFERIVDGAEVERSLSKHAPQTFAELVDQIGAWADGGTPLLPGSHFVVHTIRKFHRRLSRLVLEGAGVLRREDQHGKPLRLTSLDTAPPAVVDLSALAATPTLQRFIVATIFRQLVESRTGAKSQRGLVYLVTLDELNRFAPRGSKDPVTQLIERVAAEM
ncbi:MAG TPA: hypothetical protein VGE52_21840, partial [Pirellulales bacterium]